MSPMQQMTATEMTHWYKKRNHQPCPCVIQWWYIQSPQTEIVVTNNITTFKTIDNMLCIVQSPDLNICLYLHRPPYIHIRLCIVQSPDLNMCLYLHRPPYIQIRLCIVHSPDLNMCLYLHRPQHIHMCSIHISYM